MSSDEDSFYECDETRLLRDTTRFPSLSHIATTCIVNQTNNVIDKLPSNQVATEAHLPTKLLSDSLPLENKMKQETPSKKFQIDCSNIENSPGMANIMPDGERLNQAIEMVDQLQRGVKNSYSDFMNVQNIENDFALLEKAMIENRMSVTDEGIGMGDSQSSCIVQAKELEESVSIEINGIQEALQTETDNLGISQNTITEVTDTAECVSNQSIELPPTDNQVISEALDDPEFMDDCETIELGGIDINPCVGISNTYQSQNNPEEQLQKLKAEFEITAIAHNQTMDMTSELPVASFSIDTELADMQKFDEPMDISEFINDSIAINETIELKSNDIALPVEQAIIPEPQFEQFPPQAQLQDNIIIASVLNENIPNVDSQTSPKNELMIDSKNEVCSAIYSDLEAANVVLDETISMVDSVTSPVNKDVTQAYESMNELMERQLIARANETQVIASSLDETVIMPDTQNPSVISNLNKTHLQMNEDIVIDVDQAKCQTNTDRRSVDFNLTQAFGQSNEDFCNSTQSINLNGNGYFPSPTRGIIDASFVVTPKQQSPDSCTVSQSNELGKSSFDDTPIVCTVSERNYSRDSNTFCPQSSTKPAMITRILSDDSNVNNNLDDTLGDICNMMKKVDIVEASQSNDFNAVMGAQNVEPFEHKPLNISIQVIPTANLCDDNSQWNYLNGVGNQLQDFGDQFDDEFSQQNAIPTERCASEFANFPPVRESILLAFDPLINLQHATPALSSIVEASAAASYPSKHNNTFSDLQFIKSEVVSSSEGEIEAAATSAATVTLPPRPRPEEVHIKSELKQESPQSTVQQQGDVNMSVDVMNQDQSLIKMENDLMPFDNNVKSEDTDKKMKEADIRVDALLKRISEKDRTIAKLNSVISAYENSIAVMPSELEAEKERISDLQADRDSNHMHLVSLESTFSDLILKYEKAKLNLAQRKEEDTKMIDTNLKLKESLALQEQRYEKMKNHAIQQLNIAHKSLETMTRNHASELTKLNATIKKLEIKQNSYIEQLAQKSNENEQLVKICDELIQEQGGHNEGQH